MYSLPPVPEKLNPVVQYTEDPEYKYIDLSTLPNSSNLQLRVHVSVLEQYFVSTSHPKNVLQIF